MSLLLDKNILFMDDKLKFFKTIVHTVEADFLAKMPFLNAQIISIFTSLNSFFRDGFFY